MNPIAKAILKFYSLFIKKEQSYLIFESAYNFYDNSFALYRYIKEHYPEYKLKYLVTTKEMKKSAPINGVSKKELLNAKNKLALYKYSLKAKVFFFSHINYWRKLKLQDSTKIVYLNHGEFPIKDCGEYYDFLFSVPQENKLDIVMGTKHIDEVLSKRYPVLNNHNHVIVGAPRNDEMFAATCSKEEFYKNIGVETKDAQLILSMTTFRNRNKPNTEFFKEEFPLVLNKEELSDLDNKLKENNQILLIKLHHSQTGVIIPQGLKNIIFLTNKQLDDLNISISNLYNLSDCLITDYSSSYLSYLNLDRPICFILADKDKYGHNQGLTIDNIEEIMPGEKVYSKEELLKFFDTLKSGKDNYSNKRKEIRLQYSGDYQNHNCESVTNQYLK